MHAEGRDFEKLMNVSRRKEEIRRIDIIVGAREVHAPPLPPGPRFPGSSRYCGSSERSQ